MKVEDPKACLAHDEDDNDGGDDDEVHIA